MTKPGCSPDSWRPRTDVNAARRRARMLQAARTYFAEKDILEVDTPALGRTTVTEPHVGSFEVVSKQHSKLYLQTSPEYFMKRMLAAGYPDIGQICKVFRDGEIGPRHLPEFTMAEWYRLGFDLQDIMHDTVQFVARLLGRDHLVESTRYISYQEAFEEHLRINPLDVDTDTLAQVLTNDEGLLASIGNDRDAWLDLAISTCISTKFPKDVITILYHYPASQAALAQRAAGDKRVADRFELYIGSLELANGFVELQDETEQRERFEVDNKIRRQQRKPAHQLDEYLLSALAHTLPPCAGVAVGIERLLMVQENASDITAISAFTLDQ